MPRRSSQGERPPPSDATPWTLPMGLYATTMRTRRRSHGPGRWHCMPWRRGQRRPESIRSCSPRRRRSRALLKPPQTPARGPWALLRTSSFGVSRPCLHDGGECNRRPARCTGRTPKLRPHSCDVNQASHAETTTSARLIMGASHTREACGVRNASKARQCNKGSRGCSTKHKGNAWPTHIDHPKSHRLWRYMLGDLE